MDNRIKLHVIFFAGFLLSACESSQHAAPVVSGWSEVSAASRTYRVQKEDTFYAIAFRYGIDYRKLAEINHLTSPYTVAPGQILILPEIGEGTSAITSTVTSAAPAVAVTSEPVISPPAIHSTGPAGQWLWPANGPVTHVFSENYGGNKGIEITGKTGDTVKATAAGKVVYSGSGLKDYGLLIIIKHDAEYLSAYAHNGKLLVKEGEMVTAGEPIALMSGSEALHFEIRKAGKPVDPLKLLTPK